LGEAATLLLLDVDRFKDINDRFGHAVGDDVLCAIAVLIRDCVAETGPAGRLGGDEFVVALPCDLAAAELQAERLRAAVEALELANYPGLRCSISVGMAPAPDGALGLREWLEAADRALYRAKHAGRNRTAGRDVLA
jgi:diguanylate cyclase